MRIKIAVIPGEHIDKVQDLSLKLQDAMEAGEMKGVDQIAIRLLSLTDKNHSLSLSEEYWHQLIEQIRSFDDNFQSDYILAKPQLEMIIAAGLAESFTEIVTLVEYALKNKCAVLQLPYEEEDKDV